MALTNIESVPASSAARASHASLAAVRIRRCTFRRLIAVDARDERIYEAECLDPDRALPMPLGDLRTAMPICNGCTALHVFRADED